MRLRSMGARRALVASALLALAALTVVAGGSAARTPGESGAEGSVDVQWTPVGLRDAKTTVILQLAGDPVTVAEANAGREFDKAEKSSMTFGGPRTWPATSSGTATPVQLDRRSGYRPPAGPSRKSG